MGGKTLQDNLRVIVSRAVEEAARNAGTARKSGQSQAKNDSGGPLSGGRGVLVGAGVAALAPFAVKGAGKLAKNLAMNGLNGVVSKPAKAVGDIASKPVKAVGDIASKPAEAVEKLGSGVGSAIGDKVSQKVEDAGGPAGILKDAAKSALPFGGGGGSDDAGNEGVAGVGKGRRMPIQQSVDIGVPLESVYNQWTQFEKWPEFMHRVTQVTQEDDCTVSFATKIWGKKKEFKAKIESQRPDERVQWRVSEGMSHTGVVTFHELGPRLTRVQLSFDVDPGGMLEKLARGARHIKRAARGDLHRFKAYLEMHERETGAWRGVIEDGKVTQKHDSSYDDKREYFDESGRKGSSRTRKRGGSSSSSKRSGGSSRSASSRRQASSNRSRQSGRSSAGSAASRSGSRGGSSSARGSSSSGRGGSSPRSGSSSARGSSNARRSGSSGSNARNGSNPSSRSGSNSSSRSGSSSSRSSGRSASGSSRSASSTRSRAQASRSNGRG